MREVSAPDAGGALTAFFMREEAAGSAARGAGMNSCNCNNIQIASCSSTLIRCSNLIRTSHGTTAPRTQGILT